jgi:hypothetical protein
MPSWLSLLISIPMTSLRHTEIWIGLGTTGRTNNIINSVPLRAHSVPMTAERRARLSVYPHPALERA